MKRASNLFSDEQRKRVESAVVEAESVTSCEIVPVVASASGRYDRSEDIGGIWLAAASAVIVWLMLPLQVSETGSWGGRPVYIGVLIMMAAVFFAFIAGVLIARHVAWLRLLFTPRKQMRKQVTARAREIFFDKRVHHTRADNGLLIYVSLFERMAVVFGDQEILDKLGQDFLDQLCKQLTADLQKNHTADAMCSAIEQAGKQLSDPLPRTEGDVDELQNALVLID